MADQDQLQRRIADADGIDDYVAIDADLRALAKDKDQKKEYRDLLGRLNAKSAGAMFALKAELERAGEVPTLLRQAIALKRAGYPTGDQGVAEWRNEILRSDRPSDLMADILVDTDLSTEDANRLARLAHAADDVRRGGINYGSHELNWTDIAMSPVAQGAHQRVELRIERIADYDGSDVFVYFRDKVFEVDSREALDVILDEARRMFSGVEYDLLADGVRLRQVQLAASAFTEIVDAHGWDTVQALYERGDVTSNLAQDKDVKAFMALMRDIQTPLDQIRRVDSKLGAKVVQGAWDRSGEIRREGERMDEVRDRLDERLGDL